MNGIRWRRSDSDLNHAGLNAPTLQNFAILACHYSRDVRCQFPAALAPRMFVPWVVAIVPFVVPTFVGCARESYALVSPVIRSW